MAEFAYNVFKSLDEHDLESNKAALKFANVSNWTRVSGKDIGYAH